MKLVLVDVKDVRMTRKLDSAGDAKFCLIVQVRDPNGNGNGEDKDEDGSNKLIQELTEGKCHPLTIAMDPRGGTADYELLIIQSGLRCPNILTKLKERFADVMISLEIFSTISVVTVSDDENDQQEEKKFNGLCLSSKGMVIRKTHGTNHHCHANSNYMTKFNLSRLAESTSFHVKITAHICDSNEYKKTNMKILNESLASDVVIQASNGAEVQGHKCFLIATSPVIQRMFESEMTESEDGRIDMTDISEEGVRAFLRYLYYGDLIGPEENIDVAYDLLYAAHKYDVPKLEERMKTYLFEKKDEEFSTSLAFKMYSFVKGLENVDKLKKKMAQIMHRKFDELKELPEYQEVFQKNPSDAMEICSNLVEVSTPTKPKPPPKPRVIGWVTKEQVAKLREQEEED